MKRAMQALLRAMTDRIFNHFDMAWFAMAMLHLSKGRFLIAALVIILGGFVSVWLERLARRDRPTRAQAPGYGDESIEA